VTLLRAWENFYVIMGSAAAGLTGLQFVVIALVADVRPISSSREIDAFATPTIVHFGAVLLLSGAMTAPWPVLTPLAAVLGVFGAAGIVYAGLVWRRARRTENYRPVLEDWLFHVVLPGAAYITVAIAAASLRSHAEGALFATGAVALLLLFVGIHNAWDTVTYVVLTASGRGGREKDG